MRQLTWAFLAGLMVTGCSATPEAPVTPPPPPPPTRPLVAWSNTVCSLVKPIDEIRTKSDTTSAFYVSEVVRAVSTAIGQLKTVEPARVAAADDYVKGLLGTLEGIRPQLPGEDTTPEQDRAKAEQVAGLVTKIEPQEPKLIGVAESVSELLASYNLAPACGQARAVQLPEPAPTRALVTWADTMCATVASVNGLGTDPVGLASDERFADFELDGYLRSASGVIGRIAKEVGALAPTGVREADEFRDGLVSAAKDAAAKMPEDVRFADPVPLAERRNRAGVAAGLVGAVKPKAEGLPAVIERGPALAAAHELAPRCQPRGESSTPKPPPTARNGTDLAACQSGTCQVQISGTADITVQGRIYTVRASGGALMIASGSSRMSLSGNGTGRFGMAGGSATVFRVSGFEGATAVLDISTE